MDIIAAEPSITNAFFSGNANLILAACVIVLGVVVAFLYKDNQKLQEKLLTAIEQRVEDAKNVNERVTGPLDMIARTNELIYRKLYDAKKET